MRFTCLTVGAFAACMSVWSVCIGSPQAAPQAKAASKDALTIHSAGLDKLLVDPRDQPLLKALKMIDDRLVEVPAEVNQPGAPMPAVQLALELLSGPMSLRAGLMPDADPNGGAPFYAQVDFFAPNRNAAEAVAGRFGGMTAGMLPPGQPAPGMPGVLRLPLDANNAVLQGVTKVGDQSAFTLALNVVSDQPVRPEAGDLPAGVAPVLALTVRASLLQEFLDVAFAKAPPHEIEPVKAQLAMAGLYGPDAMDIHAALGYGADRSHAVVRYVNFGKRLDAINSRPSGPLTAADLKRVPADATYAALSRTKLAQIPAALMTMAPPEAVQHDPMAMAEQQTGIHPQRDVFNHLGELAGLYMADSTGGGGLLSAVAFVEVINPEALTQTMTRMSGMVNQIAQQHARGYIRVSETTLAGRKATVLTFPGLPVPLEVCWALQDGCLYAAATPTALIAGLQHASEGKSSLNDNPRFKELAGNGLKDAMQVQFLDVPRMARDGYGLSSLAMSALANAVRSPRDPAREPGLVMPLYSELVENAKGSLSITRLEGDDLVMRMQSDRSVLLNMSGAMGMLGGSTGMVAMTAASAGVMLPALAKARQSAKEVKSMTQLKQLGVAIAAHAADHEDRFPKDVGELVELGLITEGALQSPMGPAPDGGPDYWINTGIGRSSEVDDPSRTVLSYDRAMYATSGQVCVLFVDGHVEKLGFDEFHMLIAEPPNDQTDFQLP